MPQRTDILELGRLGLTPGQGRRIELHTGMDPFHYGGEPYTVTPPLIPLRLDVSRTTGDGWALRLRFDVALEGPCMRCLEPASPGFAVDVREIHQPGAGEELASPYVSEDDELDLAAWAREALALELPTQLTCRTDCAGLCGQCGANLNEQPAHHHDAPPDARWAKLSELKFDEMADSTAESTD
jgi:uncharacterized protein